MPDLASAATALVDQLTAGGVSAAIDSAELNLPGVLVDLPVVRNRFGKGWEVSWTLVLASPGVPRRQALSILAQLLDEVADALDVALQEARPVVLQLPDQGPPVPAYEITFTQRIT